MGGQLAFEVGVVSYGLALEWLFHHNGVKEEIAKEDADGKKEEGRVGCGLSSSRILEILDVHSRGHKGVEGGHEDSGKDGKDDAFLSRRRLACPGILFGRGKAVEDKRQHYERHATKDKCGVALVAINEEIGG